MTQQPQQSTKSDSSENNARNDDELHLPPLLVVEEEQIMNVAQYDAGIDDKEGEDEDDCFEDDNDEVDDYIFNEIQRELDAEIESQFQEMLDENQKEIEDELQRQIDVQLQKSMDDQMEEYYNNRPFNNKRSHAHEPSSSSSYIEEHFETTEIASTMSDMAFLHQNLTLLGLSDPSATIATNKATGSSVESINAQIDGIISKYNASNLQQQNTNFYNENVLDRN